jgi:hypothetical protein
MPTPKGDDISAERQQLVVYVLPVEPGQLVVLTVGVVAVLGVAEFVAVRSIGTPPSSSRPPGDPTRADGRPIPQ